MLVEASVTITTAWSRAPARMTGARNEALMQATAVVVDDHPMCRQATAMAIAAAEPGLTVVEASTLADGRAQARSAHLMTLDLALPDNRSVLGLPAIRADFPHLKLLVISGAANPDVERQVAGAGAHGYVSKAATIPEMIAAIRAVLGGERWFSAEADAADASDGEIDRLATLTPAQTRVLHAMAGGRLNKQIAFDLGLSEITVKAHVKAILKKLGVPNRTQAILLLQRAEA